MAKLLRQTHLKALMFTCVFIFLSIASAQCLNFNEKDLKLR